MAHPRRRVEPAGRLARRPQHAWQDSAGGRAHTYDGSNRVAPPFVLGMGHEVARRSVYPQQLAILMPYLPMLPERP
jgi:hypothetical protein